MTVEWKPMILARCGKERSVMSPMYALEPAKEALEPTPIMARLNKRAGRVVLRPVPTEAMAVVS